MLMPIQGARAYTAGLQPNEIRNPIMTGGVAGSAGTLPTNWTAFTSTGLTRTLAFGTEAGIPYCDWKIAGTASGASGSSLGFEANTQIVAVVSQIWIVSGFVKLQAGSLANLTTARLMLRERNAGGSSLATTSSTALSFLGGIPGLGLQGVKYMDALRTAQATCAFVQPSIEIAYNDTAAVDVTFRIGGVQCYRL